MFFPALIQMLTEVDDDIKEWAESQEEGETASDAHHVAIQGINRLASELGEKTVMLTCTPIIQQLVRSANWKDR